MVEIKRALTFHENEKLLNIVEKQLEKGKRHFGSSGASLTHQISNPIYKAQAFDKKISQIGLEGENKTTTKLKKWIQDKPNAVIVDSLHIKGMGKEEVNEDGVMEAGDTDHLLIIGNHIVAIDSKAWKNKASYQVNEEGVVLRTKKEFPGGRVHMKQALYLWKKYLDKYEIEIEGIIVIARDEVFVLRDRNWWRQAFKLTNYEDFYKWLDKIYEDCDKETIYSDLIADIVKSCVKPYNPQKELMGNIYHLLRK